MISSAAHSIRDPEIARWSPHLGVNSLNSANFQNRRVALQRYSANDALHNQSNSLQQMTPSQRPQMYGEREMDASGSTGRNARNRRNEIRTRLANALVEHVPLRVVPAKEVTRHVESSADTIDARRAGQIPAAWAEMIEWCRAYPGFGMEVLDMMGIDIDADPRAFAKFLELKNLVNGGSK